jgi:hypothetical protein
MLKEHTIKVLGFMISITGIIHRNEEYNSTLVMVESRTENVGLKKVRVRRWRKWQNKELPNLSCFANTRAIKMGKRRRELKRAWRRT